MLDVLRSGDTRVLDDGRPDFAVVLYLELMKFQNTSSLVSSLVIIFSATRGVFWGLLLTKFSRSEFWFQEYLGLIGAFWFPE